MCLKACDGLWITCLSNDINGLQVNIYTADFTTMLGSTCIITAVKLHQCFKNYDLNSEYTDFISETACNAKWHFQHMTTALQRKVQ